MNSASRGGRAAKNAIDVDNNTLTVYIRRLRIKIEDDPGKPNRIITVRGMGYKWSTREVHL